MVEAFPVTDIWHEPVHGLLPLHHFSSHIGRKTHELLDYANALESKLEGMRSKVQVTQAQRLNDGTHFRHEVAGALKKVHELHNELAAHRESDAQAVETAQRLKDMLQKSEIMIQEQLNKKQELEFRVEDLELELEMKHEVLKYRKHQDDKAIKDLEAENEVLKRKAAVSCMLGFLTDFYLQLQPEGKAAAALKLVQKIQRELKHQNVSFDYSGKLRNLDNDYVENEIKRLFDVAGTSTQNDEEKISPETSASRRASLESSNSKKPIGISVATNTRRSIDSSIVENEGDEPGGQQTAQVLDEIKTTNSPKLDISNKIKGKDDISSRCARFIVNCFDSGNDAVITADQEPCNPTRQIEVFEADPPFDIEHARLSGSTLAEIKILNRKAAERAEMMNCSSQIKTMLGSLEKTIASFVESDKQSTLKEPQTRHLANITREGLSEIPATKKKQRFYATGNKF